MEKIYKTKGRYFEYPRKSINSYQVSERIKERTNYQYWGIKREHQHGFLHIKQIFLAVLRISPGTGLMHAREALYYY
jgi:hypothetical protein